ncbi:MAG: hypothetical protein RLZ84_1551, partial [Actinomycetota bacterium]
MIRAENSQNSHRLLGHRLDGAQEWNLLIKRFAGVAQ